MEEIWKDVIGYETLYKISNLGRIYSLTKQSLKSTRKKSNGYIICDLCKNGKVNTKHIHRLVAEAFIPNPNNYLEVNHKDGNKTNNCVNNLEWCSKKQNMEHAVKTGLIKTGVNHPLYGRTLSEETKKKMRENHFDNSKKINQYDLDGNFIKTWDSVQSAINYYNNKAIEFCCKKRRKSASGFQWQFYENNTNNIEKHKNNWIKKINQYDVDGNFIQQYNSIKEVCEKFNVFSSNVTMCCQGKQKTLKGFVFKYANE